MITKKELNENNPKSGFKESRKFQKVPRDKVCGGSETGGSVHICKVIFFFIYIFFSPLCSVNKIIKSLCNK